MEHEEVVGMYLIGRNHVPVHKFHGNHSSHSHPYKYEPDNRIRLKLKFSASSNLKHDDITFVTAFFNLGSFQKGLNIEYVYTPDMYLKWMSGFANMKNPLVVYTDDGVTASMMRDIRRRFQHITRIIKISRKSLWAFDISKEIKDIYSQENYPKFYPNTVNENYSCSMHAKYELVNRVAQENMFKTKYIGWIDMGYLRDIVIEGDDVMFPLVPLDADDTKVSFSQIDEPEVGVTKEEIILTNKFWVGGGMFYGIPEVVMTFTKDYMRATNELIKRRLINTDQQVIYSLYAGCLDVKPRVQIHAHTSHRDNVVWKWFYLGYLLREPWLISTRTNLSLAYYMHSQM